MTPESRLGPQPQVPATELITPLRSHGGHKALFSGPDSVRFIAAEAGLAPESEAAEQVVDLYWENPELVDMYASRVTETAYREHGEFVRARRNALTGLPNRIEFREQLASMIMRARPGDRIAVFGIDLNGFKSVNDKRGHTAGDEVLINTARTLRSALRSGDDVVMHGGAPAQANDARPIGDGSVMVVSHLAGDEFAVAAFLPTPNLDREVTADERRGRRPVPLEHQIIAIGGRIQEAVDGELRKVDVRGLSAAMGIAVWEEGMSLEELLYNADMAMFRVKRDMQRRALEKLSYANRLLLKAAATIIRFVGHDPWRMANDVLGEKGSSRRS